MRRPEKAKSDISKSLCFKGNAVWLLSRRFLISLAHPV
jgi:hypothetical protein